MSRRDILIDIIRDADKSPVYILGAAIAFLRAESGVQGQRIADAVDKTIMEEILKMEREKQR